MNAPRVAVVIPTWNGLAFLRSALRSLQAQHYRDFEVIVVDNASADGTGEALERDFPEVRLVTLKSNTGFAPAVNAGIQAARGEFIVLLNNDVEAAPGWLAALVTAMDGHPEVGACASKMLIYSDPTLIDSAGDQFGLFASAIGHGEPDGPKFNQTRYVLSACGGAAAYRRSALDRVGLLDERYFAYFEDVDLGIRLQFAGYKCLYVPHAVVRHHGSATSRRTPAFKFYLQMRNALILFFQYAPLSRLALWGPAVLAWPFVRAVIDRQSPALAVRSVYHFVRDLPPVLRRRREINATRRISWSEFRELLAHPLVRQGRRPRPAASP